MAAAAIEFVAEYSTDSGIALCVAFAFYGVPGAERIAWAALSARQRLPEIVAIHDCRIIGGGAVV